MAEFNSNSDLVQNTKRHLQFLEKVNNHQNLYEGNLVKEALYRYEKLWLILASKHPEELIIPPLDIQWVWYVHMLSPKIYEKDCKAIVGKLVDTRYWPNSKEVVSGLKLAKQYWGFSWPDEKFEIDLDRDWSKDTPRTCNSNISYDLQKAITRQQLFSYHVALPHYKDLKFLEDVLRRYKRFLRLKQLNPDASLIPCYDIDLIWHTHLGEPVNYAQETRDYLGRVLDHNDTVDSEDPKSYQKTRELWMEVFNESLSKEGCMSRGDAPVTFSKVSTSPFNYTANKYSISLMNMELNNCNESSFTLAVYKRYRYKEDKKVLKRNGPNMSWSGSPPRGIKNFHFDSSKCSHLSLVLKWSQGVCCFKESEVLGRHHLSMMNDSQTDFSSSQELKFNLPLILVDNTPAVAYVQLKIIHFPLKRGPLVLRVQSKSFSSLSEPPADIWGPVPLPTTNPARPELPNDVYIATHSLLTHHNKIAYKVQVIHGVKEGISAILVRNEHDMQVISEAHLIGPDQLPLRDQLENPERCVFLSDQRTERAMLIRDAKGDWGICVGRWAAYRKNMNSRPALQKKVGMKNPGFLNLRFYDLRKEKMMSLYVPCQEKNSKSFHFDFNLNDVYVDMEEGHIIVSKHSTDHAQNVALGFSVCILFALCQPYPPPSDVSVSRQITVNESLSSTNQDQSPIPSEQFPKENNLRQPRYKPSDWRTPRKKFYSNENLMFLSVIGYWYYSKYPVYYECEVSSDFQCRDILVWDEEKCEGDFSKGIDNNNKDEDVDNSYDNEMITLEEFVTGNTGHEETQEDRSLE